MGIGSHGGQAGREYQRQWPAMDPDVDRGQGLTPGRELEPCQNSGHCVIGAVQENRKMQTCKL